MQSILVYGRLLARAFATGIYSYSDVPNVNRELKLVTASCGFSKDLSDAIRKRGLYGDDAWFISGYKTSDVLGVADGVGGWRIYGVDPSLFSSSLMKTCERIVHHGRFNPGFPAGIIATSYYELLESKVPILGSSTACIVVLDRTEKTMHTANLGDSGYRVIREGQIVHRSAEQQHYFNTPFQLSLPPPEHSGLVLSDSPESADTSSFLVEEGDLIVVASDGLFDNMSDRMIIQELSKLRDRRIESIQKSVNSLALQARKLAFDPNYLSPFAVHAKNNGINTNGGKPDDITILLASVALSDGV